MTQKMLPKGLIFGSCLCTAPHISRKLITIGQYVPENIALEVIRWELSMYSTTYFKEFNNHWSICPRKCCLRG